jgi:hypothetical protein
MKAHEILSRMSDSQVKPDSIVNVYPNPFIEGVSLEFYTEKEQDITVTIFKSNGKKLDSEQFRVYPFANNLLQLDKVKKLKSGQYIVTVQTAVGQYSRQIQKRD